MTLWAGIGLGNGADGVYRREPVPGDLATEAAFEKPPGHAVHGHQHQGVGPDQRPDAFGHAGQRGRLDGDHHQVLHAERFGVGHRVARARCVRTSPRINERPSRCSASSVAPRATTLSRWPACARPTPIQPPMAPAP
jgi:hypothetical protein